MLIQQKVDGSNAFNRSWTEYKVGFNDTRGNYWLGNELLSQLTHSGRYKLRFELQLRTNLSWYWAEYSSFVVFSERYNYTLQVSGYSGNLADAFSYHSTMMFSTYDRDNDPYTGVHCAASQGGGFWYRRCYYAHVTGSSSFTWRLQPPATGWNALQTSRMWLMC